MKRTCLEDADKLDGFYRVVAAALGLVSFGLLYAWVVNRLERQGYMENRSSWFVAFGSLVTIVVRCLIMPVGDSRLALLAHTILAFAFSGTPMMVGQWLTKSRVDGGFRSRLKDREWIANRNGHRTAQQ